MGNKVDMFLILIFVIAIFIISIIWIIRLVRKARNLTKQVQEYLHQQQSDCCSSCKQCSHTNQKAAEGSTAMHDDRRSSITSAGYYHNPLSDRRLSLAPTAQKMSLNLDKNYPQQHSINYRSLSPTPTTTLSTNITPIPHIEIDSSPIDFSLPYEKAMEKRNSVAGLQYRDPGGCIHPAPGPGDGGLRRSSVLLGSVQSVRGLGQPPTSYSNQVKRESIVSLNPSRRDSIVSLTPGGRRESTVSLNPPGSRRNSNVSLVDTHLIAQGYAGQPLRQHRGSIQSLQPQGPAGSEFFSHPARGSNLSLRDPNPVQVAAFSKPALMDPTQAGQLYAAGSNQSLRDSQYLTQPPREVNHSPASSSQSSRSSHRPHLDGNQQQIPQRRGSSQSPRDNRRMSHQLSGQSELDPNYVRSKQLTPTFRGSNQLFRRSFDDSIPAFQGSEQIYADPRQVLRKTSLSSSKQQLGDSGDAASSYQSLRGSNQSLRGSNQSLRSSNNSQDLSPRGSNQSLRGSNQSFQTIQQLQAKTSRSNLGFPDSKEEAAARRKRYKQQLHRDRLTINAIPPETEPAYLRRSNFRSGQYSLTVEDEAAVSGQPCLTCDLIKMGSASPYTDNSCPQCGQLVR